MTAPQTHPSDILDQIRDALCAGCGRALGSRRVILQLALFRLPFHAGCANQAADQLRLLAKQVLDQERAG